MRLTFLAILLVALAAAAGAQGFSPGVAPLTPPPPPGTEETQYILTPPPAPASEYPTSKAEAGLFGWQKDCELSAYYLLNHRDQYGLFGLLAGGLDLKFNDPWLLAGHFGLAEDALEYRLGLGTALGYGDRNLVLASVFCDPSATLYLKEGSLWDGDPFVGLGINVNLLGTDWAVGGSALKIYCGLDKDFGLFDGKTELLAGYGGYRTGNARYAEGFFFSAGVPVRL